MRWDNANGTELDGLEFVLVRNITQTDDKILPRLVPSDQIKC